MASISGMIIPSEQLLLQQSEAESELRGARIEEEARKNIEFRFVPNISDWYTLEGEVIPSNKPINWAKPIVFAKMRKIPPACVVDHPESHPPPCSRPGGGPGSRCNSAGGVSTDSSTSRGQHAHGEKGIAKLKSMESPRSGSMSDMRSGENSARQSDKSGENTRKSTGFGQALSNARKSLAGSFAGKMAGKLGIRSNKSSDDLAGSVPTMGGAQTTASGQSTVASTPECGLSVARENLPGCANESADERLASGARPGASGAGTPLCGSGAQRPLQISRSCGSGLSELGKKESALRHDSEKSTSRSTEYSLSPGALHSGNSSTTGPGKLNLPCACFTNRRNIAEVTSHWKLPPLDGQVVIKVRHKVKGFKDENDHRDWLRVMKTMYYISSGLSHNLGSIANLYDVVQDEHYYYAIMEYVRGRDLFDYFMDEKPQKQVFVASLGRQMAQSILFAVAELHYYGLVHRDLKLENFVLDESMKKQKGEQLTAIAKIIDFDTIETFVPGKRLRHVLGTDQYIAPECYAGYASRPADVFGCGVVIYTLMSGTFPFHARMFDDSPGENYVGHQKMMQIRQRILDSTINFSDAVWSDCPPCKRFVLDCMDMEPSRRPQASALLLDHPWWRGYKRVQWHHHVNNASAVAARKAGGSTQQQSGGGARGASVANGTTVKGHEKNKNEEQDNRKQMSFPIDKCEAENTLSTKAESGDSSLS